MHAVLAVAPFSCVKAFVHLAMLLHATVLQRRKMRLKA